MPHERKGIRKNKKLEARSYLKIVLAAKKPQKPVQIRGNSLDEIPTGSVGDAYFLSMRKNAPQSICASNDETRAHLESLVFSNSSCVEPAF